MGPLRLIGPMSSTTPRPPRPGPVPRPIAVGSVASVRSIGSDPWRVWSTVASAVAEAAAPSPGSSASMSNKVSRCHWDLWDCSGAVSVEVRLFECGPHRGGRRLRDRRQAGPGNAPLEDGRPAAVPPGGEAQHGVGAAAVVQIIRSLCRRFLLERGEENELDKRRITHGTAPIPKGADLDLTKTLGSPQIKRRIVACGRVCPRAGGVVDRLQVRRLPAVTTGG